MVKIVKLLRFCGRRLRFHEYGTANYICIYAYDLEAGGHMTIQVPQNSCCHDAKVTRRVSSCSNTRACEALRLGHVGALQETIMLSGSYLAAPFTVWTVTCHLRVFPSLPSGSPLSRSARHLDRGCVTKVSEYALGTAVGQTLWGWDKHLNITHIT